MSNVGMEWFALKGDHGQTHIRAGEGVFGERSKCALVWNYGDVFRQAEIGRRYGAAQTMGPQGGFVLLANKTYNWKSANLPTLHPKNSARESTVVACS